MEGRQLLQTGLRTLASIIIAAIFLLLLVVASAQQQAMVALKNAKSDMSYSVARKIVGEATQRREERNAEQKTLKALKEESNAIQTKLDEDKYKYYKQETVVRELASLTASSGKCKRFSEAAAAEDEMSLWQGLQSCLRENALPKQVETEFLAMQAPDRDLSQLRLKVESLASRANVNRQQMEDVGKEITELTTKIDNANAATDALEDVKVISSVSIISFLGLAEIPPALMQIFLSFAAGLFGALLLTLILAVYPNNGLSFSAGEGYWNRVLLGGLISVSVFVVLGGGVAVLGTTDALTAGDTNFLSFSAIGILAGMFSDRVAKWLSDRAEIFVNDKDAFAQDSDTKRAEAPQA